MEFVFYFLGFGTVIMFMILMFDKQQNRRLNKILKETQNVQPLFLLRAAEQKLRTLNTQLYGHMAVGADAMPTGRINMDEGARQLAAAQLGKLVNDYKCGNVNIKSYNNKLTEMLDMVGQVQGMNFEHVNIPA